MEDINKNNQISCYLKGYFEKNSISQKQIQEDLDVSQQYVSAILSGKKSIGKRLAEKLALLYGVDKYFLITGKHSEEHRNEDITKIIKNKPHDEQMQLLYDKIDKLESTIEILKERDQLYFKAIIAHLGIGEEEEREIIENKKSSTN